MKKFLVIGFILVVAAGVAGILAVSQDADTPSPQTSATSSPVSAKSTPKLSKNVVEPVDGFFERQSLNKFGTHVTEEFRAAHRDQFPAATAQYPKFYGYHAAVDADFTAPADADKQIPVRAVAAGTVVYKQNLTGYGGLIIIRHEQPESVTTLYGHVRLDDSPVKVGDSVKVGQLIAYLGDGFSADTSGERKHLHFGIHKGAETDVQGYEPSQQALEAGWYDPNVWLRKWGL